MIKYIIVTILISISVTASINDSIDFSNTMSVADLEESLGKSFADKKPRLSENVSVENGESLIRYGFSKDAKNRKSRIQSKHFVCTSCHNLKKEDPDLSISDPEARLTYAINNNLPFLQGTTLYGAVNRNTFYNGDYEKKYGELVEPARNDIRGAIQLCAVECAQGRKLRDWELESILAYLWTIDLKVSDLNLSESEIEIIKSNSDSEIALSILDQKYLDASPATFKLPPPDRKKGTGLVGNPENGEKIYEKSCLHCHERGTYSYLSLDKGNMSLNYLEKHIDRFTNQSLYQVTRWGVPTKSGKRSYMPQYTAERLSDQQLADLRAYIER